MTILIDKKSIEKINNKQEIIDLSKAREIANEIIKFGVNQNQIIKIIKLLCFELEDRSKMIKICQILDDVIDTDSIKTKLEL
jgi:glycerol-3-phosphate cytidylyltransferase-like family protein